MTKELFSGESLNIEIVKEKIFIIRGKKVMLDSDLAMFYGVETKVLNQSLKRNIERFPKDFMFQLNKAELSLLQRSQFVTFEREKIKYTKYLPFAFTEQGIAMLSSVLKSQRAIQINIQIIRIFTKLREMIDSYKELREKVEEMEKNNENNFQEIFKIIRLIINKESEPKNEIGFNVDSE